MQSMGIVGTGSYLPETVVGNEEVARRAGTTAEWIERKTGIRERRHASPDQATSDLAAAAAERALAMAGVSADRVGCVVVATSTPDHLQPATANLVQQLIGARGAAAFDLNAVCSGFVHGLHVVERLLDASHDRPYGLVIGADIYSRILDHGDRRTAVLFGDGAGAALVGPVAAGHGAVQTLLASHGDEHRLIGVPAGGSRLPASAATLADGSHHFQMDGRGVRSFVHRELPLAIEQLLRRADVPGKLVKHFVPHQANGVMLAEVWPALGLENAALHLTVDRYGNTGAASVAITLDALQRAGALLPGDLVLLAAFGGGMSVGASLHRWAVPGQVDVGAVGRSRAAIASDVAAGAARDAG